MCYSLVKPFAIPFGKSAMLPLEVDRLKKQLGSRLKAARESKGLTQEELVERMGYKDKGYISEYENGKRGFYAYDVPKFAEAIGVPITFFFLDSMTTSEDFEVALLEWFRDVPADKRKRVFEFLELNKPLLIGGEGV